MDIEVTPVGGAAQVVAVRDQGITPVCETGSVAPQVDRLSSSDSTGVKRDGIPRRNRDSRAQDKQNGQTQGQRKAARAGFQKGGEG